MMHETARHAIHSLEIISVSVETFEAMQQQVVDHSPTHNERGSSCADAPHQIRMHLNSKLQMLRSLFLRS
jgi:hypothetical protein